MFQIGPSLREARTRRGLSPADVHKAVRIRERYLTAIEEERWEMLPGDAYTKGFLRTYAEFLGLDGQLYVEEYNARIAAAHAEEPLVPDAIARRPGRGTSILFRSIGAAVVVGAAAAALGLAWGHRNTARPHPTAVHPARAVHQVQSIRTATPTTKPVKPKPTFALIRATRDRSWLSVRIGGPAGKEIYRGTLQQGGRLKYGLARPIWVRMGRPLALDIRIGRTPVAAGMSAAPANLLLTAGGAVMP